MDEETATRMGRNLRSLSQAELNDLANHLTQKHGPLENSYGEQNTIFGWTEDGKGVWILPGTKANHERFEEAAKTRPDMGRDSWHLHNEAMRLAGAEFFADWRDSDRARAVNEQKPAAYMSEEDQKEEAVRRKKIAEMSGTDSLKDENKT